MKQEKINVKKMEMKRVIIAAIVFISSWRLGVYLGFGALIGGAVGGLLVFFIFANKTYGGSLYAESELVEITIV